VHVEDRALHSVPGLLIASLAERTAVHGDPMELHAAGNLLGLISGSAGSVKVLQKMKKEDRKRVR
jgi:hypothetical protein